MIDPFIRRFDLPGASDGPLAGLTFAVKDNLDVAGVPTGAGSPEWESTHEAPARTAPSVQRLLDAGARLVGKTHMDEMAFGLLGRNERYGMPANPRAPDRVPGGSSSGSAAAVAAGEVDFALGTDTGGSVRVPAASCGVYGLRTTHGAVPLDGCVPFAPRLDTIGLFARDLDVLTRAARALLAAQAPPRPAHPRLIVAEDLLAAADEEVRAAAQAAIGQIEDVARMTLAPDGIRAWRDVYLTLQFAGIRESLGPWVREHRPPFGPGVAAAFELVWAVTDEQVERAEAEDNRIRTYLRDLLGDDAFLCFPTAPEPPLPRTAGTDEVRRYMARTLAFTCVAGLGGLPELTVPLVAPEDGLPIGLSLVGPPGGDLLLPVIARRLQQADSRPWQSP